MVPVRALPSTATCLQHPGQPAVATCARCGVFVCAEDARAVQGVSYCATCAALPEVGYLEQFREQCRNKRDVMSWFIGLNAVSMLITSVVSLFGGHLLLALLMLVDGGVSAAFWLRMRWARLGLIGVNLALGAFFWVSTGTPLSLLTVLMPLMLSVYVYNDTHSRLFFGMDVPEAAVRKAWDAHRNNPLARSGLTASLFGLVCPGLGVLGLVCSLIALGRVDPSARPPVGRRGQAMAGIAIGTAGTLAWAGVLFALSR